LVEKQVLSRGMTNWVCWNLEKRKSLSLELIAFIANVTSSCQQDTESIYIALYIMCNVHTGYSLCSISLSVSWQLPTASISQQHLSWNIFPFSNC
jgi:hypothetical protein